MAAEGISETLPALGVVAAAAAALLLRLRGRERLGGGLALAAAALALVLLVFDPPWRAAGEREEPSVAVLLVDLSRSQGSGLTERVDPRRLLGAAEGRALVVGFGVEPVLLFDGAARDLPDRCDLPAAATAPLQRRAARMGPALGRVLAATGGAPLDLVLATDGGLDPRELRAACAALRPRLRSARVVGLPPPPEDLHLRSIALPSRVAAGERPRVEVEVFGVLDRPRRVVVAVAGGERRELELLPRADRSAVARAVLEGPARAPGDRELEVRLEGHQAFDADGAGDRLRLPLAPLPGALGLVLAGPGAEDLAARLARSEGEGSYRAVAVAALGAALPGADTAILTDVSEDDVWPALAAALERHLAGGGGLLLAGARRAFGLGGWSGGSLERLSPLLARPGRGPLRLTVCLDRSGSMDRDGRYAAAARAAAALVSELSAEDSLRVLAFGDRVESFEAAPGEGAAALEARLLARRPRGGTDLVGVLEEALATPAPPGGRSEILLLSDGRDERLAASDRAARLAERARGGGHRLSVFWFDRDAGVRAPLEVLVAATGGVLEAVDDFAGLRRAFLETARAGLEVEDLEIRALDGRLARLPLLLRTRRRPGIEVLAGVGDDRNALAERAFGAGRVAAAPIGLEPESLRAVWGREGEAALLRWLAGLAAPPGTAVGALEVLESPEGFRFRLEADPARVAPAALRVGEAAAALHRTGLRTWTSEPVEVSEGPQIAAVEDRDGRLLARRVAPAPELLDLGGETGDEARGRLAAALRGVSAGAARRPGAPWALAVAGLLALLLDLGFRALARRPVQDYAAAGR